MTDQSVRRISVAAVIVVALVAAICSYAHLYELALEHGEGWRAHLIPLSIDGMLVAATLAIVSQRRHGRPAGWVPWLGLVLGIVASLAGNVAAAQSDLIARLIASWPPVALAVSIETLVVILRGTTAPAAQTPAVTATAPEPPTQPAPKPAATPKPPRAPSPAKKPAMTGAERSKAYRDRRAREQQQQQQEAQDRRLEVA